MDTRNFFAKPSVADEAKYLMAIGAFMFEFSQLEFSFRMVIAGSFKEMRDVQLLIEHCDLNKLLDGYMRVLEKRKADKDGETAAMVSEFRSINTERVRVAHGTWTPTSTGLAARKTPANPKSPTTFHFAKIEELIALTNRCRNLHSQMWQLVASDEF